MSKRIRRRVESLSEEVAESSSANKASVPKSAKNGEDVKDGLKARVQRPWGPVRQRERPSQWMRNGRQ